METFSPENFLVLIVDDVSQNLQLIGTILEQAGYSTTFALSGRQTLERLENIQPDLILMDLMMPEMNGLELCRTLKADPRYRDIPIIFLTASNESKHLIEAFSEGAVDYVTKPFKLAELLARVKTHLELQYAKQELKKAMGELEKLALTDTLTGIPNRRYLYQLAEREIERSRNYDYPLSVLVIDIDRFKRINDLHGHLIGDEVLKTVSGILRDSLRREDCLARFGGEEFIALLPCTDIEAAVSVARRTLSIIARSPFPIVRENQIQLTVSIGLATLKDGDKDFQALLNRADEALIAAKNGGRNRYIVHREDVSQRLAV